MWKSNVTFPLCPGFYSQMEAYWTAADTMNTSFVYTLESTWRSHRAYSQHSHDGIWVSGPLRT